MGAYILLLSLLWYNGVFYFLFFLKVTLFPLCDQKRKNPIADNSNNRNLKIVCIKRTKYSCQKQDFQVKPFHLFFWQNFFFKNKNYFLSKTNISLINFGSQNVSCIINLKKFCSLIYKIFIYPGIFLDVLHFHKCKRYCNVMILKKWL